jgi:hypothetical protein
MKVVTIATDLENIFLKRLLIPSCRRFGLDLVILHIARKEFRFRDKRTALTHYLAQCPAPDELILYTDAYDTVFVGDEQQILEAYGGFSQSIVFSAEPNSWPLGTIGFALAEGPPSYPYPYLNSGGFIGLVGDLEKLLAKYPEPPSDQFPLLRHLRAHGYDADQRFGFSDQYYWTLVRLLESEVVGLDNNAALFENFAPAVADVWDPAIRAGIKDFLARGKEAPSYQQERERLELRLSSPSGAAQVHFASIITKAVALDLLNEGRLPGWLCGSGGSGPPDRSAVHVCRVSDDPRADIEISEATDRITA